jgi:hypothetical protein
LHICDVRPHNCGLKSEVQVQALLACIFHGLDSLACSKTKLVSETMNPLDILVQLLGQEISPSQGLYLHRATQNTHADSLEYYKAIFC